ncbi:transcriptional regulator ATRX [Capsicum chacoense]
MVVALGPGKFYGSSLPRPRFYENLNGERVDPPVSVLDPLMSWAEEAHWSMGGLSFKRLRLQGRIEGNIKKLRSEKEKIEKKAKKSAPKGSVTSLNLKRKMRLIDEPDDYENEEIEVVEKLGKRGSKKMKKSAPKGSTASLNLKRKVQLVDESDDDENEDVEVLEKLGRRGSKGMKKKLSRKGLNVSSSLSPPDATVVMNLKRKMQLVDESDDEESEEIEVVEKLDKRGSKKMKNLKRKVQLFDEAEGEKIKEETKKKKKLLRKGLNVSLSLSHSDATVNESDDESEEMGVVGRVEKRGAVRKLYDDFDRVVAEESGRKTRSGKNREAAAAAVVAVEKKVEKAKTKGGRLKKGVKSGDDKVRTSPRLMKNGLP